MRCLSPRTVGFLHDGKTITWSPKNYSKEYATFQLPCSKCIECRLEYARQWAVRCIHEAKMHQDNSFITLTYSDQNLKSPKLQYIDFQLFIKRLRKLIFTNFLKSFGKENWKLLDKNERKEHIKKFEISTFVTGEYGDKQKRPHWHALIFNYRPQDTEYKYTNHRGDKVYTSQELNNLWENKGLAEIGSVTFQSAGYCARYAAKKLVHTQEFNDEFKPISKKSSKNAIGKKFLEKYWQDIFNHGEVILDDGTKSTIPRYYEKWLLKNHPDQWVDYVTKLKASRIKKAELKTELEKQATADTNDLRKQTHGKGPQISREKVKTQLIEKKFKQLQSHLKGDI